jgi:hypothetical protein
MPKHQGGLSMQIVALFNIMNAKTAIISFVVSIGLGVQLTAQQDIGINPVQLAAKIALETNIKVKENQSIGWGCDGVQWENIFEFVPAKEEETDDKTSKFDKANMMSFSGSGPVINIDPKAVASALQPEILGSKSTLPLKIVSFTKYTPLPDMPKVKYKTSREIPMSDKYIPLLLFQNDLDLYWVIDAYIPQNAYNDIDELRSQPFWEFWHDKSRVARLLLMNINSHKVVEVLETSLFNPGKKQPLEAARRLCSNSMIRKYIEDINAHEVQ